MARQGPPTDGSIQLDDTKIEDLKLVDAKTTSADFSSAGFYVRGHEDYLFLNDATSEDSAAEFAIVKGRLGTERHVQIESITFSWCSSEEALAFIREALAGGYDASAVASSVSPTLETPAQHGRCPLCA